MTISAILSDLDSTRSYREELYKFFHQHPELSLQEFETSKRIISELESYGVESIQRIGDTGVVAVISNGDGPVVALRGDIDALPMAERSGKEYAAIGATQVDNNTGQETPVAHTCGHDVHISSLLGAVQAFNSHRELWNGTLMAVFQPAEETAAGARMMVEEGIVEKLSAPDVYLGQHVLGSLPGGAVGTRVGAVMSEAASIEITLHGKGSHGSMPNLGVDPIVLGSAIVTRLQSVISREIAASETAVLTVGSFHAGTKSNIIPDSAVLQLNTRAFSKDVAAHLHEAIERIVRSECAAARCPEPPEFKYYDQYPLTSNDESVTAHVRAAFDEFFGENSVDLAQVPASEDFSIIPDAFGIPYSYWGLGGFADHQNAPGNHSPAFAPDIQPTLDRGVEALVVAASAWLVK
ncbi:amidohydrolase [[Brevibacterium] flavum]|uniref:Amidohydrolase n=1 Tax=[Brevibacterium] flavum TaxID=92706 RepID=A0A0F6WRU0_9CORY|nr:MULTISPECIES: amidohydrolase [Corynebacterium]AKF28680.1 amidohydrolase [[Brevibacterium] flavum]ANE09535.1 amidohydrolase [Corynebacterium glutamicum]AST21923.1 amidohydrolase [Corynebacterium glutamicum ATCC 14067]KEI24471.1 amidohydrolase [Corynebacterium glutamicum ATCC 14067]KIH72403.1 amidohydrolase [Corynebacterium glutamicum]